MLLVGSEDQGIPCSLEKNSTTLQINLARWNRVNHSVNGIGKSRCGQIQSSCNRIEDHRATKISRLKIRQQDNNSRGANSVPEEWAQKSHQKAHQPLAVNGVRSVDEQQPCDLRSIN